MVALAGTLAGCGGGGGSSSNTSTPYNGSYTRSDAPGGTGSFTLVTGGRVSGTVTENGTGATGDFAGRIVKGEITGSLHMHGGSTFGFQGAVSQNVGGRITMHVTFAGTTDTGDFTLTRA